jgi:hypothetical protein
VGFGSIQKITFRQFLRENANAQATSMDNMGNRDEPNRTLCSHVERKGEKRDLSKTTEILRKKK